MSEKIIVGSPFIKKEAPKESEEAKDESVAEAPSEAKESESDAADSEEVDYKAELEKAETKLKKAEYTIYKQKKDAKDEVELPPDERVNALVEEKLNERLGKLETSLVSSVLDDELARVSSNEEEKKLIKFHYENTIRRSGVSRSDVQVDLDKARLLANAAKYRKQATELEASVKAKKTTGNSSYGGSQTSSRVEDDYRKQFSAHDWDWMQKRGFSKERIKATADAIKASKLR